MIWLQRDKCVWALVNDLGSLVLVICQISYTQTAETVWEEHIHNGEGVSFQNAVWNVHMLERGLIPSDVAESNMLLL